MGASFTLTQLRYFVAVARYEHMTAAAKELNVTQSTLSSAIAQLETELGVALFVRLQRRGLQLTPAGRVLLGQSAAFLEEAAHLTRLVRDETTQLSGELTVGMYAPFAPFRAPVLLQRFTELHPEVTLQIFEGDQAALQQALLEGRCEVALMYDLGVGDHFSCRAIEQVPPHAIVPAEHPLAVSDREAVSLGELAHEPLILLNLPHTREYYLGLYRQLGLTPNVRHVSLGYETVRSFVALGHGYSVLNQWVAHGMTYAGKQVVSIRLQDPLPPTEVRLVRVAGQQPTRKALAFEELCVQLAAEQGSVSPAADATPATDLGR